MTRSNIRAPKHHGEYVISPVEPLKTLLQRHQKWAAELPAKNAWLSLLREQARRELLSAAESYSSRFLDIQSDWLEPNRLLFLSGHQPEFFHPGVWFKNIFLFRLGQQHAATSIHLIIDNDECRETSVVVPTGTIENPHREMVEFDSATEPLPYEQRRWVNRSVFGQFVPSIQSNMATLSGHAMIADRIPELSDIADSQARNLGEWIAQIRYLIELEKGIQNLEVPLSQLCQGSAFCELTARLILDADRFQSVYNESLLAYRRTQRIRSQSHPVPNLVRTDGWIELPFWIWSESSPQRGPLYAKRADAGILISDLDQLKFCFGIDGLSGELAQLGKKKVAIRPRALMTTMFARLFLADLFVHGIGGAKYDELTNTIIQQYFSMDPPEFLTATSTHFLPIDMTRIDEDAVRRLKNELRTRRFTPEKYLDENQSNGGRNRLVDEKKKLLAEIPNRGQKRNWHQAIEKINQQLFESRKTEFEDLRSRLKLLEKGRRSTELLTSREYSFLLHPPALLDELSELAQKAVGAID